MTTIESRIQNIEEELKIIKSIIDGSKQSIDKYLYNKFCIIPSSYYHTDLYRITNNGEKKYLRTFMIHEYNTYEDIIKSYISTTYSIPDPTIVTISINNQTYYDFIQ